MNKYRQLIEQTVKRAIGAAIISALAFGVYIGVSYMQESAEKSQQDAESKLSTDNALLASLRSQMDKSGDAEKRFSAMMDKRTGDDFTAKTDNFKTCLLKYKDMYKLAVPNNPTSDQEMPTDRPDLVNLQGYAVYVRPKLKIDFQAISDVHVFSFIEEMRRSAPGLVRVDRLEIKRAKEMTDSAIDGMRNGSSPNDIVGATLEVSLIGVRPKEDKNKNNPSAEAKK